MMLEDIVLHDVQDKTLLENSVQQLQALLKQYIKADDILFLGHIVRNEGRQIKETVFGEPRRPASFVHADWGPDRIKQLPYEEDPGVINSPLATLANIKKFVDGANQWAIYNIWLPLKTVTNNPLTLCDVNSVEHDDIIKNLEYKNNAQHKANFISLKYKPSYRWFYYPLMQSNELLIFKQFESKQGVDHFIPVFHTAFKNL